MIELVPKEDCSTTKNRGTRITDRKKLEDKKIAKLKAKSKKLITKKFKYKYIYIIRWDNQRNRKVRTRVYLKNNNETQ